jgi:hypothetical protein
MLHEVNKALGELISNFQQNPLDLLYESDLQAFLFMKLRGSIDKVITLSSGVLPPETFKVPGRIETSLVHTEYPAQNPGWFDVAVIDPELTQSTAEYQLEYAGFVLQNESVWGQRVRVAVELKQVRIGFPLIGGFQGLSADLTKLQRYTSYYEKGNGSPGFTGIGVLFIQSCAPDIRTQIKSQRILSIEQTDKANYAVVGISGYVVTPTDIFKVRQPCDG